MSVLVYFWERVCVLISFWERVNILSGACELVIFFWERVSVVMGLCAGVCGLIAVLDVVNTFSGSG